MLAYARHGGVGHVCIITVEIPPLKRMYGKEAGRFGNEGYEAVVVTDELVLMRNPKALQVVLCNVCVNEFEQ